MSLPYHVYYSFPLKAHYFTAGCVRGGPSLWTLCRGCINQTSHSGKGSTHWHGTAHSTLEDKRKNTQPKLLLWNIHSFWRLPPLIISSTITPNLFQRVLQHFSTISVNVSWHCPPLPFPHSGQQDLCMGKWHQWTVSEFPKSKLNKLACILSIPGIPALPTLLSPSFWQCVKDKKCSDPLGDYSVVHKISTILG